MVQKILRTMQDDLKAAKNKQLPGQDSVLGKNEEEDQTPAQQIKDDLQRTDTNQENPQTLEKKQEAPVLSSFDSPDFSSLMPKPKDNDEIEKIKKELEKSIKDPMSANQEDTQRMEEEGQAIEEQRKRIEEAQKKALEEERIEKERKAREEEERQRIEREKEEERKKIMQEEQKRRMEEERRKTEEEAKKIKEEMARLQAERKEENIRQKAQEEEKDKSKEEIGNQEVEEDEELKKEKEKQRRIEREMARVEELKKREEELHELKKMQERISREEEIEKKVEEERKAREEEEKRKIEEIRKKEEALKRAEEEAERQEEELARKEEEEIKRTEEEAKKMEMEAKQIEEDLAKKEEELQNMERKEKERIDELMKNEEKMAETEKELERKERELKEKETEMKKREELRKKMRAEILGGNIPKEIAKENNTVLPISADKVEKEDGMKQVGQIPEKLKENKVFALPDEEIRIDALAAKPDLSINKSRTSAADKDIISLVKRVSNAINTTTEQKENYVASTTAPKNPDKDKDLKELIARMSKDLEKEKEMLRKEQQENSAKPEIQPEQDFKTETVPQSTMRIDPLPIIPDSEEDQYDKESEQSGNLSQPPLAQMAALANIGPSPTGKPAENYWTELHDTLKKPANTEKPAAQSSDVDPKETGLITPEETPQEESALLPLKARPEKTHTDSYVDPENRLIFGKQEFYSSMHKKVKPKTQEADLEELKETVKEQEVNLSDEEEKKKLRHQIITKYKIELFSMPWAKIILFSFLLLTTLGVTLYIFIPKFVPKEQAAEEILTGESIAEMDKLVPQKIVAKQKEVSALNYFDGEIDPWKPLADGSITRLIINNDDHEVMLTRDEALKTILGKDNYGNVPQDVLGFLDNKYNILAFKNNDVLRLGIVFKYDRNQEENFKKSMTRWAETSTKAQKIHNVMKALFANSKIEEKSITVFQPSSYSNVNIYYLNLPDTDTSMDYFIYKGYLIFTTSKDTTSEMIDLLQQ